MKTCPNKNLKEYNALEKGTNEFEAYRVYIAFDNDIPKSFRVPGLSKDVIKSMANYYTGKQSLEDTNLLSAIIPKIVQDSIGKEDYDIDAVSELELLGISAQNDKPVKKDGDFYESLESKKVTEDKIALLNRGLNAKIVEDPTIDGFAQVDPYEAGEIPTIRVNFSRGGLRYDTIIHEYGHIFIDALGGMKDASVIMGRQHLVGSDVEAEVMNDPQYSGLDQETLDKEILATAMGREGHRIYSAQDGTLMSRFQNWARLFFNRLKKALGLDYNGAMYLAEQMLGNQVQLDPNVSIGSEFVQRQAFPKQMTAEQESAFGSIDLINQNISSTSDGKFYKSTLVEGNLQRTTNRIDSIYPESKFPEERAKYYAHSRAWGNINDEIWNSVVEGKNFDEVKEIIEEVRKSSEGPIYKVAEDQMKVIYDLAKDFVEDQTANGNVVLAQQRIYSPGTMVAGTTDIVVIKPNGHIDIFDNKSSTNPTRADVNYGPNEEWNYWDRGRLESYAVKHQKQLSAYKKMYQDRGITVDNLFIIPVRWLEINKDNATVDKVDNEPIIHLSYSPAFAERIIDNKQKKGREKFLDDEGLLNTVESMNQMIAERVQVVMARYESDKKNEGWYNAMQVLAADLATNSSIGNIIKFINIGQDRTKYIEDELDKVLKSGVASFTDDALLIYKSFANTWNLVDDMYKMLKEIENEFSPKINDSFETHIKEGTVPSDPTEYEKFSDYKRAKFTVKYMSLMKPRLNQLSNRVNAVNQGYYALALEKTARDLASVSTWGEKKFRADKLKEWKEANPRTAGNRRAWEAQGKEWVNEQVASNQAFIASMNYDHFKELLKSAPKDIDSISMWIVDPRNQDDGIIQVADKLLTKAEFLTNQEFISEVQAAEQVYQEFVKAKKVSELNYDTLYEDLYEVDENGKPTNMLVGKYKASFKTEERKWFAKHRKTGYKPTFKERQEFYAKLRAEHINPQWQKLMAMEESNPIRKMYDTLLDRFQRVDQMLPVSHSLGVLYSDSYDPETRTTVHVKQFRLPSIEKSTIARLKQQGVGTTVSATVKDMFIRDTEYTESGQQIVDQEGERVTKTFKPRETIKKILVDEQNREAKFVPIHYRGKVDKGQQSLDLMSISMIDFYMASNFSNKRNLVPTMEMLIDVLQERKVMQTDASGNTLVNAVKGGLPFKLSNKEKTSNAYKALASLIDDRLYGIGSIDLGEAVIFGKKVNMNKLSQQAMAWTGDTFLMLNHLAAGTGFLQGNVMNWMEAVAGTDISKSSLLKAEAMYMGVTNPRVAAGILRDIGARRPTGLVNLLAEKLNARSDFRGLHARYGTTAANNLVNRGTLHGLQHMQEHFVQSTLMLGILIDEKLEDKNGKRIVDKEGNEVSMLDAYQVSEDGFLQIKEEYKEYVTQDLEFEISSRIREVTKNTHGNYDNNNKAMIQRYVLGKMVFMLRKWLVTGVQKRYRGITSAGLFKKEAPELGTVDDKFFSESLGRFEEGMYTTAAKFVRRLFQDAKILKMRAVSAELDNMTAEERANLKRTVYELGMIVASLLAATVLGGLAKASHDDDEKKLLYYLATLNRRLYSELRFYTSISEGYRVLKSPMATLSIVEKVGALLGQAASDVWNLELEEYKTGPRKGTPKIQKKLYDLVPIMNQTDRNIEEIYKMISGN